VQERKRKILLDSLAPQVESIDVEIEKNIVFSIPVEGKR